jgi:small redox-active disulfide protein 2
MKKIQILGTGCPKCNMLKANAETAIRDLGIDVEIEKISDIKEIMNFGVMSTPAIAIDGKVISAGKVLKPEEIKKHLG